MPAVWWLESSGGFGENWQGSTTTDVDDLVTRDTIPVIVVRGLITEAIILLVEDIVLAIGVDSSVIKIC